MDIGETIRQLNEAPIPLQFLVGGLIGLVVGYTAGSIRNLYAARREEQTGGAHEAAPDSDLETEVANYQPRTLLQAMSADGSSTIKGTITEFYITKEGYSGVIADQTGKAPFFFDDCNVDTCPDEALVPILLNHSMKTGASVEMDVEFNTSSDIFEVGSLRYRMNNIDYEIG